MFELYLTQNTNTPPLWFQFVFGVGSELVPILQKWINQLSSQLMHFHYVVTLQVTVAVQMSIEKIYLYMKI